MRKKVEKKIETEEKKALIVNGASELFPISSDKYLNRDNYDIWILSVSLNDKSIYRYDRVFEIHDPKTNRGLFDDENLIPILQKQDKPIVLTQPDDELKNTIIYPHEEIKKLIGDHADYIQNSIVMMLLMGYYEGYRKFEIYGINYGTAGTDRELTLEARCTEYWIGWLRGKGCKVNIYDDNGLCYCNFKYGLDDYVIQMEIKRLKKKIKFLEKFREDWENTYKNISEDDEKSYRRKYDIKEIMNIISIRLYELKDLLKNT